MNHTDTLEATCALACLKFVKKLMNSSDIVVLDANQEILREYKNNFTTYGNPTVASEFLKWICRQLTLRSNSQVELKLLTVVGDRQYAEFPQDSALDGFDLSDRKFIALANAHPDHPSIYEGSDCLWWGFKDALSALGIQVVFLCEEYVQTKYEETYGKQ